MGEETSSSENKIAGEIVTETKMSVTKKTLLILLTIFTLGPLVFVGACFPIGLYTFSSCFERSCSTLQGSGIIIGIIVGIVLAIFVCYRVIKRINKH